MSTTQKDIRNVYKKFNTKKMCLALPHTPIMQLDTQFAFHERVALKISTFSAKCLVNLKK